MSSMLHRFPPASVDEGGYQERLQHSQLEWLVNSEAAMRSLSQNYPGLPFDWSGSESREPLSTAVSYGRDDSRASNRR